MAKPHILIDKTELVLMVVIKNKFKIVNLQKGDISRIQFDEIKEFKFFRRIPSESIRIFSRKSIEPYKYTKKREKAFWEGYKEKLTHFAKNNMVTFADNIGGKNT